MHFQDELSDLGIDRRPPLRLRSALPPPVETEAFAMPADDGLRLDEDESALPSGPAVRERGPQKPIGGSKLDSSSRALALENEKLVAKGEHLGVECSSAPDERTERA
jgi:hypothetical protein